MKTNLNFERVKKELQIGLRAKLPEWDNCFLTNYNFMLNEKDIFLSDSNANSITYKSTKEYEEQIKRIDWISY